MFIFVSFFRRRSRRRARETGYRKARKSFEQKYLWRCGANGAFLAPWGSMRLAIALACVIGAQPLLAQEPNPTQQLGPRDGQEETATPLYRVSVVARTTKAVNYGYRALPTKIDFVGTVLQPDAKGEARVEPEKGVVQVRAKFKNLSGPQTFGNQFLTYVLWAITPDGRAANLGELLTDSGDDAKLDTATELQTFALVVTAEPYYAVTHPSDVVVMENVIRADTAGQVQTVDAKYELLKRGEYTFDREAANRRENRPGRMVSQREYESLVELYQARNAVQLAEANGAQVHAADTIGRARAKLEQAERQYSSTPKSRAVVTLAREATQTAEDARLIAARKAPQEAERNAAVLP
jgi:hypothetical protein